MVRVRFAPSPTGYIHIGNSRIALFNWIFALQQKGQFILRYDDTDSERSRSEYATAIAEDLSWLGIEADEIYAQSANYFAYDQVSAELKQRGLLYPCYETAEELELQRRVRLSRKLPPFYERGALRLTEKEKEQMEASGRRPHWRFLLPNFVDHPFHRQRSEIIWDDMIRGQQTVDLASLSDPVLIRADGTYLYTLPSVIDDKTMRITHILRGEDHITNTGVQIALFQALGATVPIFGHMNLLTLGSGETLSKRKGDLSLRSLREAGIEPMSVSSLAVLTGTSHNVTACASLRELAGSFDFCSIAKSSARFNPEDLVPLNRQLLQNMSFNDVADRLITMGIDPLQAEDFWLALQKNIDKFSQIQEWWEIVTNKQVNFLSELAKEHHFLQQAADLLPNLSFDKGSGATLWQDWIDAIKNATGRKGKALFHPLRFALTGRESGPELAQLLPLMGRELVLARLGKN